MKKLLLALVTVVVLGCTAPENKAIATAVNEKITQGEFDFEVARLVKIVFPEDHEFTEEEEETQFNSEVLNSMIMKKVFTKEMDKLEIQFDQEKLDEQYKQLIVQYTTEEKLIEDIEAKGFSVKELKDEFAYQLRITELNNYATTREVILSDEDLMSYYEENKETVFKQSEMVNSARHILIKLGKEEKDPEIKADALKKITEIREEILAGKDFAEAATEYSEGPSATQGGQLGSFQRGQMVPEFDEVVFSIPVNEVSEPVLTQFGYHIILVEGRSEGSYAPFEETKEYINGRLKVEQFFQDIEDNANIKKPKWAELKK